jgi:ABC-type amino acid transport system permease subunit
VIANLVVGLPGQRPGGLVLTVIVAVGSAGCAVLLGMAYASVCVMAPRASLVLQAALALLRGIPLLLLIFALAQTTSVGLAAAGFAGLVLYSLSHVGETLRSFLASHPQALDDQARLLGLGSVRRLLTLRLPWTLRRSLDALATHWISLLKDTGALVVLGIGELTTVTKVLSENGSLRNWQLVLLTSGLLYLCTAVLLISVLRWVRARYRLEGASE